MMAWTNGTIPYPHGTLNKLLEENSLLTFKLAEANKRADAYLRELENIPRAVEKYGYVTLRDEGDGNKTIKLVLDVSQEDGGDSD